MCNSSKAYYYTYFKSLLDTEKYLTIDMPYIYQRTLSHLRCSNHSLAIETERHDNIKNMFRIYTYCLNKKTYIIKDDLHVVLICPLA